MSGSSILPEEKTVGRLLTLIPVAIFVLGVPSRCIAQERLQLAKQIKDSKRITLATSHVSGKSDQATARQNILDTANGLPAKRSSYENAPGGTVELDAAMLKGMVELSKRYSFTVSEIAGGSHSKSSRHYAGVAFDASQINAKRVDKKHPNLLDFMKLAKTLGATEVLGPGSPGHEHHIHVAWPRPK